ncbi:FAD-dependent oxidoreductase [Halobacillus shinanisalinarum]|uniref:FAD-dependent oxidoreductase n=1 Tax=Halobacillus shinanisalinarum TaxID=2932258 RepID=A0ABY4H414_9BACI|nr:FAD-dependent oxidoreductase [Halobacillus shinanisalinarum]UOQ95203.1 FAD-dependent oxidoreductase [Halobacillus shinanisalinarum]
MGKEWTQPEPMWRKNTKLDSFPRLEESIETTVTIVGGGITGITTAYMLAKEGKKVTLIEADELLNGTTGHTTAKVTAQHGLIYHELIKHFGEEGAALYFKAQEDAMATIEKHINDHSIDCNWQREDAYLFATTEQGARKLEREQKAYGRLEIAGEHFDDLPFDTETTGALCMRNQAHFHPLHYLAHLLDEITDLGGEIYEHTKAVDVKEGKQVEVETGGGHTITSDYLISCSHFPFYDKGMYFSRMYAERSYVIAIEPEKEWTNGMYLSIDEPKRSIRSAIFDDKEILLIGGESHRTGEGNDMSFHYKALEEYAARTFGIKNKLFQWSTQDLTTLDKVPYIGPMTMKNDRIYVATGFRKWGMTNSTVAGQLITDYVMGRESKYHSVFTPARFKADPSMRHFLTNNMNVAAHLVEGKVELVGNGPASLEQGQGAVVQWEGKRAGAYKDDKGELHLLDTTCTHMGCEVEWNSGEHTWDCPCHGSRFSYDGAVMEGPAKRPLERIEFSDSEEVAIIPDDPEAFEESTDNQ